MTKKKRKFINKIMENCSPEKLALISTQIALELSRGKTISQLNLIKSVLTQISATMQTIISKKLCEDQENKHCRK